MIIISTNKYYDLSYDKNKNRIYYKVKGFWKNPSVVPDYLNHMAKAIKLAQYNFTFLVDLSEAKTHPKDIQELREKSQVMYSNSPMYKIATVVAKSLIAEYQIGSMYKRSELGDDKFYSTEEAENWLDEQIKLLK